MSRQPATRARSVAGDRCHWSHGWRPEDVLSQGWPRRASPAGGGKVDFHLVSVRSAAGWHAVSLCLRRSVRPTGGEMLLTDVTEQCRSDRGRLPHARHTGDRPTRSARSAGESVHPPQPVPPAGTVGLRPGGWQCWLCGQSGRADPPATAYFCCDRCDVRWYGGTGSLRHSPQFTQREYTWWIAGKLARIRYIDHAAEHTASPA